MMKNIEILYIIDDDDIYQYLASEVIQSTRLVKKIKTFFNGSEAISYIESVKNNPEELPEVIFLDLFMPVLDGWGFLEKFIPLKTNLPKRISVYIISSSIDPVDVERARAISEVSDYIIKPLTREKFLNSIRELVN